MDVGYCHSLMAIPLPEKCIWRHYDFDCGPLTLKTFSAMSIHMRNIGAKFH